MSEVSLISMSLTEEGHPFVVEFFEELGFSDLQIAIDGYLHWKLGASSEYPPEFLYITRYLVRNPEELAEDIEQRHESYWDRLNGWQLIVSALRAHPEYTWWFHVES